MEAVWGLTNGARGCVVRAEAITQLVLGRRGATEVGTRRRWSRGLDGDLRGPKEGAR